MGIFDAKKPFDTNGDGKMSVFENAKKEMLSFVKPE